MKREEYVYRSPDEIFEAAGKGQELLNLAPPEDALYSRARLIYDQFRHGELTAEQGAERRRLSLLQYNKAKEWEKFQLRWVDHAREMYKATEEAADAYIHAPGYRTADAMWQSIHGAQAKIELTMAERGDFFAEDE